MGHPLTRSGRHAEGGGKVIAVPNHAAVGHGITALAVLPRRGRPPLAQLHFNAGKRG